MLAISPYMTQKQSQWDDLDGALNAWFECPCVKTTRAVIAVLAGLEMSLGPLWLAIIGVSCSGKSSIFINLAHASRFAFSTSNLALSGLMSMERDTKGKGHLDKHSAVALWLVSEMGNFIAMDDKVQAKMYNTMRELHDVNFSRSSRGEVHPYLGRMNFIGAGTNAFDDVRKVNNEMGERIVLSRPQAIRTLEACRKAKLNAGKTTEIKRDLREPVQRLITSLKPSSMSPEDESRYHNLALLVSKGRIGVKHKSKDDSIIKVEDWEGPGRLYAAFCNLAIADAATHGQEEVTKYQRDWVTEIGYDSIPANRASIIRLWRDPKLKLGFQEAFRASGIPWVNSFSRVVDELAAIGVLQSIHENKSHTLALSEEVQDYVAGAFKSE